MVTPSGALTGSLGNNTDAPTEHTPKASLACSGPLAGPPSGTPGCSTLPRHLEIHHRGTFGLGFAK